MDSVVVIIFNLKKKFTLLHQLDKHSINQGLLPIKSPKPEVHHFYVYKDEICFGVGFNNVDTVFGFNL
jgi:hypothetical protein